jgi:hypothetical protein
VRALKTWSDTGTRRRLCSLVLKEFGREKAGSKRAGSSTTQAVHSAFRLSTPLHPKSYVNRWNLLVAKPICVNSRDLLVSCILHRSVTQITVMLHFYGNILDKVFPSFPLYSHIQTVASDEVNTNSDAHACRASVVPTSMADSVHTCVGELRPIGQPLAASFDGWHGGVTCISNRALTMARPFDSHLPLSSPALLLLSSLLGPTIVQDVTPWWSPLLSPPTGGLVND